jgi:hypothetical protein
VFDEAVFPFTDLHPYAGAMLRKEIILLDKNLRNIEQGGEFIYAPILTNPTNPGLSQCSQQTAGENVMQNGENLMQNRAHEITGEEDNSGAEPDADLLTKSASGSSQESSASDSQQTGARAQPNIVWLTICRAWTA